MTDSKPEVDMREDASSGQFEDYVPGSPEERALLRKIDLRVFPAVWIMYLMNYLDRSNIGNARVAGMEADLALNDNRYSIALLIFFVGYLLAEIPSNMILSRSRPSLYLPAIVCVWGIVAGLFATIQTYHGLVVARFFLGCVESGFFPGVMFFLSSWYRKAELAKRMAWFYSASMTSGAFGGLLAGVIADNLNGARGINGWRWLFIVEGCMTVVVSIGCMFLLPDWPSTTRWLSEDEKRLAGQRMRADRIAAAGGRDLTHWESFKAAVLDWRTYLFMFMYMMITGAGTISYFIPTITTFLGYKGHAAQFMTIPIYAVALAFSLTVSMSADYFHERPFHAAVPAFVAALCFILEAVILNNKARYAILCFGGAGIWTSIPIVLAYLANTMAHPPEKRAVAQAIVNMFANLASVYGAFLWPSDTAPRYAMGWATTAAMCFATGVAALTMGWLDKRFPYTFDYSAYRHGADAAVGVEGSTPEKYENRSRHVEHV